MIRVLSILLLVLTSLRPDVGKDPIEGTWLGTAGFPSDLQPIGFEFRRDEKGDLRANLYLPVLHFFPLELPGKLVKTGDEYVLAEYGSKFRVVGKRVEGTFMPQGMPLSLERSVRMPKETPIPPLPRGPGPVWQTKIGSGIYAPVEVFDDKAYVGSLGGIFCEVALKDGSIGWVFPAGRPIYGQAFATSDAIYFTCDIGYLYKLDRKTGKEIWHYDLGDAQVKRILPHLKNDDFDWDWTGPQPALKDGVLYMGSGDGSFHAVDAKTGTRIWRFETKGKVRRNPAFEGSNVVIGSYDGFVYAIDRATGKEVWKKNTYAWLTSSPVLVGGRLIVGNRGGLFCALDPLSGKALWSSVFWGSSVESDPVTLGDLCYIGSSDLRSVAAYDPKNGFVRWRTDVFGFAWARPAVTEATVYAGVAGMNPYENNIRQRGSFVALDRATGKLKWRWPIPENLGMLLTGFVSGPALSRDLAVIGSADGTLYAFPIAH